MIKLSTYSTEELKEELQAREVTPSYIPPMIESPAYTNLQSLAELYLQDEINGDEIETQYAYETLMETYYGEGFFDWVNTLPHNS